MIDIQSKFKCIGLISKPVPHQALPVLHQLYHFFEQLGLHIALDEVAAQILNRPSQWKLEDCDLILVVGGDGTFLAAARRMVDHQVPLIGVNLGRLGFLVDISPQNMLQVINQILQGHYIEEQRFLLHTQIGQNHMIALNDMALLRWNSARMIEFETWIDGRFVESQRADGLILATPTGSTAYALSAGGPLLMPNLDAIILAPICPHHLSNRPLVIHRHSQIEIKIAASCALDQLRLTADGQCNLRLPTNQIKIQAYPQTLRLLHPLDHDHFNLLRAKLGWGGYAKKTDYS